MMLFFYDDDNDDVDYPMLMLIMMIILLLTMMIMIMLMMDDYVNGNNIDVDDQSNWQFIILYDTKSGLFRRMWVKRRLF